MNTAVLLAETGSRGGPYSTIWGRYRKELPHILRYGLLALDINHLKILPDVRAQSKDTYINRNKSIFHMKAIALSET